MRVDRHADVRSVRAHLDRERDFGDELTGVAADQTTADHAVCLRIEDQLGEAVIAALCERTAARGPWKARRFDLHTPGLRIRLRHADPCDLRIGVGNGWN